MTNIEEIHDPVDSRPPAPLRFSALVAIVQATVAIVFGAVLAVRDLVGKNDPSVVSDSVNAQYIGIGTAVFIWIVFGIVLAGAIALLRGATWGRGPMVYMQLLLIAIAFFMFQGGAIVLGIVTALSVVLILVGAFHPQATAWVATRYGR